jgi:hypothetical protein
VVYPRQSSDYCVVATYLRDHGHTEVSMGHCYGYTESTTYAHDEPLMRMISAWDDADDDLLTAGRALEIARKILATA